MVNCPTAKNPRVIFLMALFGFIRWRGGLGGRGRTPRGRRFWYAPPLPRLPKVASCWLRRCQTSAAVWWVIGRNYRWSKLRPCFLYSSMKLSWSNLNEWQSSLYSSKGGYGASLGAWAAILFSKDYFLEISSLISNKIIFCKWLPRVFQYFSF